MPFATLLLFAVTVPNVERTSQDSLAAHALTFQVLEHSPWQVRHWQGYPFIFLSYAGDWSRHSQRVAHECRVQQLLTPTWEDPNFVHPAESSATEWAWSLKPDGDTRHACYEWFRQVYLDRITKHAHSNAPMALGTPFYSVTGHSWFSVYGAQWGCDMIGLETGENIIAMQAQLAFLRGAARQNQKPFYVQPSQWYGGTIPLFEVGEDEYTPHDLDEQAVLKGISQGGIAIPNGGHSPSLLARMWYVGWLAGAAVVCPENCQSNFFTGRQEQNWSQPNATRIPLSPIGKRAQDFLRVTRAHPNIGVPYTPVALLLDQYCGFNGFPLTQPRPWNKLQPELEDREISLFLDTLFPQSMYLDFIPGVDEEREDRRLVDSPYGDSFDVLLSNVPIEVLASYPALICVGGHEFPPETRQVLTQYLQRGGQLFLTYSQADQLGDQVREWQKIGSLELYGLRPEDIPNAIDPVRWYTPAHWGADEATLAARKKGVELLPYERKFKEEVRRIISRLTERWSPVRIAGDIQWLCNRTATGWVLGLVNNHGVTKGRMTPVTLDASQAKDVTIELRLGNISRVTEWITGNSIPVVDETIQIRVPAGEIRIVQMDTMSE